jgi:hypothetical protein
MAAHDWLGTTDASTIVAANYDPAAVPGTGDTLRFDGDGDNACTFAADMALAGLTSLVGYTDKVDLATFDLTMDDGASIVLDMAGEFDAGSGTISVTNGTFDNLDVGTYTVGSSTLLMSGTGTITVGSGNRLNELIIDVDAVIDITDSFVMNSTLQVNGSLEIPSGNNINQVGNTLNVASGGALIGDGQFKNNSSSLTMDISVDAGGEISIATFIVSNPEADGVVQSGTYAPGVFAIIGDSAFARVLTFSAGAFVIEGNLELKSLNGGGSLEIANDTNDPDIELQGNLIWTPTAGTLTYTKGTGTMTLSGLSNVQIDLGDNASENLTINKPTAGDVTLVDVDLTIDSIDMADAFAVPSGDVDTTDSATLDIGGDVTLANNLFDLGDDTTWTIGGDFDYSGITTLTDGTSTLIMTGGTVGTPAKLIVKTGMALRNITIASGAFVDRADGDNGLTVTGTLLVNGALGIASGKTVSTVGNVPSSVVLGANGAITGDGKLEISTPGVGEGIVGFTVPAIITVAIVQVRNAEPACLAPLGPAIYGSPAVNIDSTAAGKQFNFAAGNYVFTGDVIYSTDGAGDELEIDNSANANITYGGDVTFVAGGDTPTYTKGNLPTTLFGTGNQTLTCLDQATENLIINKASGNVTLTTVDLTIDSIDMADNFIVTSGDVDTTDSATCSIGGDAIFDNNALDLGDLTVWTVDAEFDNADVTTFEPGTSTLVLTGASGAIRSAVGNELNAVTIATGALVTTLTDFGAETLAVNGTLQMGGDTVTFESGLTFGADGIIAGVSGTLVFNEPSGADAVVLADAANIQVDVFQILDPDPTATPLPPGTYDTWLQIIGTQAGREMHFDSGTYNIIGRLEYETTAGDLTIKNAVNNPSFVIGGSGFSDLIFTPGGGSLVYEKGAGSYTLTESMAIESKGYDLEAIIVAAGTFTQSDDLDTVDGLTIQSGATWDCDGNDVVIANGGDLVVSGTMVGASLDAARFTVSGSATLRDVDTSGSTAEWFIDVTGKLTAYNADITNSNASGGTTGIAYDSTGTNTTNWEFRELPVGSGNAGKSGAYWHRYGHM